MHHKTQTPLARPPETVASAVGIFVNLVLVAVKGICGCVFSAPALVSDAVHSAADTFSTVVVLIGIRLSKAPPDGKHPYGHERFESVAAIVLSGILIAAGFGIGYGGIESILSGSYRMNAPPMAVAVWVALLSVLAKLVLSLYLRSVAGKTRSTALRADAFHQLSDALASLGALLGTALSVLGLRIFDPIASVFISLFLFHAAVGIFRDAAVGLVDRSADGELESAIREALPDTEIVTLRTRRVAARVDAELTVRLGASLPLSECERITHEIGSRVRHACPEVRFCAVLPSSGLESEP